VLEGRAEVIADTDAIGRVVDLMNVKYDAGMTVDFLDPAVNATIRVRPNRAFGIAHDDFTGSPTRWVFE